jgi:hypothetical protein
MTTNVPQDVIDTIEIAAKEADWERFDSAIAQLRAQRQQGSEPVASPDGEDYLRLSKSGYTLRVGWGDSMRFVAASPKPLHELSSEQQKQWLDDAQRLCDGWNRATPPQANNATEHPCDLLVAAAYRKAAEICDECVSFKMAEWSSPQARPLNHEEIKSRLLEAIPADAEAALREVCMKVAEAVDNAAYAPYQRLETKELESIVNSVLGECGK